MNKKSPLKAYHSKAKSMKPTKINPKPSKTKTYFSKITPKTSKHHKIIKKKKKNIQRLSQKTLFQQTQPERSKSKRSVKSLWPLDREFLSQGMQKPRVGWACVWGGLFCWCFEWKKTSIMIQKPGCLFLGGVSCSFLVKFVWWALLDALIFMMWL